jgi:hypothetical protein
MASALAEERSRTEAIALEAERRKLDATRIALAAAEVRARAQAEAGSLSDARSRTQSELRELRARLNRLWMQEATRRGVFAAKVGAAALVVAGLAFVALRPGDPAPITRADPAPLSLKLDYTLRTP